MDDEYKRHFLAKYGSKEHIDKLLEDPELELVKEVVKNPALTSEHITKIMDVHGDDGDGDLDLPSYVTAKLAEHPNIQPHHIDRILSSKTWGNATLIRAMKNPAVTSEHITKGLAHSSAQVREAAMRSKHVTPEQISKGLDDDYQVAQAAAHNSNATHENLMKAVQSPHTSVVMHALLHRNATSDHVEKVLSKNPITNVRDLIATLPYITPYQHQHLLKDHDTSVRESAQNNVGHKGK